MIALEVDTMSETSNWHGWSECICCNVLFEGRGLYCSEYCRAETGEVEVEEDENENDDDHNLDHDDSFDEIENENDAEDDDDDRDWD